MLYENVSALTIFEFFSLLEFSYLISICVNTASNLLYFCFFKKHLQDVKNNE